MIIKVTADTPVSDEVKNHHTTRLCAGPCGRWTRNSSTSLDEFPNTVVRCTGDKCQKCINDERRANPEAVLKADKNFQHTVTGLEHWMGRRRERLGQSA